MRRAWNHSEPFAHHWRGGGRGPPEKFNPPGGKALAPPNGAGGGGEQPLRVFPGIAGGGARAWGRGGGPTAVGGFAGGERARGVGELEAVGDGEEMIAVVGFRHHRSVVDGIVPLALLDVDGGVGEGKNAAAGLGGAAAAIVVRGDGPSRLLA